MRTERPRLSVMQGRLVPPETSSIQQFPRARWRDEFPLAAAASLAGIEWIYDAHGADINPLSTDEGILEMRTLADRHGLHVGSVCADYLIDSPCLRVNAALRGERIGRLLWLIERCRLANVQRVVLPFVDAARIETDDDHANVVELVEVLRPACLSGNISLHLETSLDPSAFSRLLAQLPDDLVFVTYDSGNSAAQGYDVEAELMAYGERIGSVHVKDRMVGGGTVPLGQGNANLGALFEGLARLAYGGDFVMQVARGVAGQELDWVRSNREIVLGYIERASAMSGH